MSEEAKRKNLRAQLLAELTKETYGELKKYLPGEPESLTAKQLADVIVLSIDMLQKHPTIVLDEDLFAEVYAAGLQMKLARSSVEAFYLNVAKVR